MSFTIKVVNKSCLCSIFNQIMKDFNPKYYSISILTLRDKKVFRLCYNLVDLVLGENNNGTA